LKYELTEYMSFLVYISPIRVEQKIAKLVFVASL